VVNDSGVPVRVLALARSENERERDVCASGLTALGGLQVGMVSVNDLAAALVTVADTAVSETSTICVCTHKQLMRVIRRI
jgi:hypothetical protein